MRLGRRCLGQKHPCAIDSDRLREQNYCPSLYTPVFLDCAPNPFRAHGSEPKDSLEDKVRYGRPVGLALPHSRFGVGNCIIASRQQEENL